MKVKTKVNIDAELADSRLDDHLSTLKKIPATKKKKMKKRISSGTALRQNLIDNIRHQGGAETADKAPDKDKVDAK